MSDAPDKPGSAAPVPPGGSPRATTTQPLAPVDPAELPDAAFETTGSFRTVAPGVPVLDAPFPTAAPAPAGPPPPTTAPPGGAPRTRAAPQGTPVAGAPPAPPTGVPGTPAPRLAPTQRTATPSTPVPGATATPAPRPGGTAAPGTPAPRAAASGVPTPRPGPPSAPPAVPTGSGAPRTPTGAAVPRAPGPVAGASAPRTPTHEQPAAMAPRTPTREPPSAAGGAPGAAGLRAPLGSPTGEFLTEQAHAAGPAPQPGVIPARVFRPPTTGPANPPLPSLGVRIAPVIPPLAPVKAPPRAPAPVQAPRVPHRPTRDPMSETSLGIPVVPPLPPPEADALPPLDVHIAPVASGDAAGSPATTAPADPEAQLAWKAERLDTLDYFELLGVPATASATEVKRAFYRASRAYHPDRFFHLTDEVFKARVHEVYKRATEAYYVLRDDVRRRKYRADVTGPDRARKLRFDELSEQETKAQVKQQVAEQIGVNPKARQLFQTGMTELEKGNLAAAERSLKMALTYEPQNALYKEKLALVQDQLHEQYRREGKAFKIT